MSDENGDTNKVSKLYAAYSDYYQGSHKCAVCTMYREHTCSLVKGSIMPEGHCRFWEALKS